MYERLAELMEEKRITAYRLSHETGITQATLSRWKSGKTSPSAETLQVLANYFCVSVDYLLGNEAREMPSIAGQSGLSEIYFSLAKEAQDNEIDPDDFRAVLKFYTDAKNKRNR